MGCLWFIYRKIELHDWLVHGNVKNRIIYLNVKRSLIS